MKEHNSSIGLKGRILRVAVVDHNGLEVFARDINQRNLILDQGMNALGDDTAIDIGDSATRAPSIAELFKYCVRGTGSTATKEVPTGTYKLVSDKLSWATSTRNFTTADLEKLVRSADGKECIITAIDSVSQATVRAVGTGTLSDFTGQTVTIYSVNQTSMAAEVDRTNTYSSVSGENSTTDATSGSALTGKRTLKRTFVFPVEPQHLEAVTGTYNWSASTLTRASGTRDFTSSDVGKYIKFTSSGQYAKISAYTSATTVTLDRAASPAESAAPISIYGYGTYSEIGFSHLGTAGANINIRLLLENGSGVATPVDVLGTNPETPGQRLKITYQMDVTCGPAAIVGPVTANITDPGNVMSTTANKKIKYVLENLALSGIDTDGETDLGYVDLEPYYGGYMALSPSSTALTAFGGVDRSEGAEYTSLTPQDYIEDSFSRVYEGAFDIDEAVGDKWRTMGLFDPSSESFVLTCLFTEANQKKDGEHSLTLRWRKTWARDLS